MARYRYTATTDRSPEEVFAYFSDLAHLPEWDPGVIASRRLDDGPLTVRSSFAVTLKSPKRPLELVYRVTELNPGHTTHFEARTSTLISTDAIEVALQADGLTRFVYDARLHGVGLARLAEPFFLLALWRAGAHAARSLDDGYFSEKI